MYTLDTNAIIYYLHGEPSTRAFVDAAIRDRTPLYVSVITETELLRFPSLQLSEEAAILDVLPAFSIIPLESHLARAAGALGRAHNLKLADSVILPQQHSLPELRS